MTNVLLFVEVAIEATRQRKLTFHHYSKLKEIWERGICSKHLQSLLARQIKKWAYHFLTHFPTPSVPIQELLAIGMNGLEREAEFYERLILPQEILSIAEMEQLLSREPKVRNIPTIRSYLYYRQVGDGSRAKEIFEDLVDMWKERIEDKTLEILCILPGEKDFSSEIFRIIDLFGAHSLPRLEARKAVDYWLFLSQFGSIFLAYP